MERGVKPLNKGTGEPGRMEKMENKKAMQLIRIEGIWTVLGYRSDGTHFDYRFGSKKEAKDWIKNVAK